MERFLLTAQGPFCWLPERDTSERQRRERVAKSNMHTYIRTHARTHANARTNGIYDVLAPEW